MKNYFITGLAPEKKARLQEASAAFCDMNIDVTEGIVVDEDTLPNILAVLGAVAAAEHATSFEGIVRLDLLWSSQVATAEAPKFVVTVAKWNGNKQGDFIKIAEEILVPSVRANVVLSVPHGNTVAPASDGKFHVLIWSAPAGQRLFQPPARIWGCAVDCNDNGFLPSGQGAPIVDTETGWAVAELVGSNLYVHHDMCHNGTDRELAIFRRLCKEVAAELSATPEEKADRQRKLAESRRKASRDAYIKECSRRFEKTVQGTKEAVAKGHADIAKLQQELVKRVRETQGAERKLEQLSACKSGELERYGKEFDSLIVVPGVEGFEVANGVIKVFTEHIYIKPEGHPTTYDIGKFRMEIYTSGSNGGILFFNLTRKGKGGGHSSFNINHPHVNKDGQPCLGNIKETIPNLIGEYEYSAVVQIGLQFLKTVNLDDSAGSAIFDAWPKKEGE